MCCTDLTALFYDMHEGNRLLYDEMRRFPDRILGYASLHSTRFGQEALRGDSALPRRLRHARPENLLNSGNEHRRARNDSDS